MEQLSISPLDTSIFTGFSGGSETALTKNISDRVISETEKNSEDTGSKQAETDNAKAERAQAEKVLEQDYEVRQAEERHIEDIEKRKAERPSSSQQDLNDYYSKLAASNYIPADYASHDPLKTATEGVKHSAQNLNNVRVVALQKGMSIEDAVNIKSAKAAYEANMRSLKSTIEVSA